MSLMWSGPSRALQFHMDLFRDAKIARDDIRQVVGAVDADARFVVEPETTDDYDRHTRAGGQFALKRSELSRLEAGRMSEPLRQRLILQTAMGDADHPILEDGNTVGIRRDDFSKVLEPGNIVQTRVMLDVEYDMLNRGSTYYISHNMAETVTSAAANMGNEMLYETDLPSDCGVIVFEYPLIFPDIHPDTGEVDDNIRIPYRAIGWCRSLVGVRDETGVMKHVPGITWCIWSERESYTAIHLPSLVAAGMNEPDIDSPIQRWRIDSSGWAFGRAWKQTDEIVHDVQTWNELHMGGVVHSSVARMRRWMLALFRLTWQRIFVPDTYLPTRAERRRSIQLSRPLEDGYIKVLKLRREVEPSYAPVERDAFDSRYNHRWVVEGHWRRQHYPSLGPARNADGSFNHDSHRLIKIEPYVKGPDFAPLVVGQQIVAVVR